LSQSFRRSGWYRCADIDSWFIREGEVISVKNGISRFYAATLAETDHQSTRYAQIVMSSRSSNELPYRTVDAGCKSVVLVKYQLTGNDMKLKNRQFWKLKKKYWRADFQFVVKIGPADLRFKILGKNGVLSSSHDNLVVEFMDPSDQKNGQPPRVSTANMPMIG
jgi:hypothetical protein